MVPFVALVGAQFLFRYGYYGEWLPNTYYAKHVRPWYESGWSPECHCARSVQSPRMLTGLPKCGPLFGAVPRRRACGRR